MKRNSSQEDTKGSIRFCLSLSNSRYNLIYESYIFQICLTIVVESESASCKTNCESAKTFKRPEGSHGHILHAQ